MAVQLSKRQTLQATLNLIPAGTPSEVIHIGEDAPTDPNTKAWINPYEMPDVAVLCSPQKLTDEQKKQARDNIGVEDVDGDYITKEDLQAATDAALAQAKASGEFNGKDGDDGYTPIKGID